jgi:hypothetical protein
MVVSNYLQEEVVTGVVDVIKYISDKRKTGVNSIGFDELTEVGFKGKSEKAQSYILEFIKDGIVNLRQDSIDEILRGNYELVRESAKVYLGRFEHDPKPAIDMKKRESLPKEGDMSEDIAPFLKEGDMVYFDPVPNLRIALLGHRGRPPKRWNYLPRKEYPKTGWYPLLKDPYVDYPEYKLERHMHQLKIQELGDDMIQGSVFGSHWFYKYKLNDSEETRVSTSE